MKKVALELGGKSPFVILDDADFPSAVADGVDAAYENSGPDVRRAHAHARAALAAGGSRGASRAEPPSRTSSAIRSADDTQLGPLISSVQLGRVRGYIEQGIAEGAKLVTGGAGAARRSRRPATS